jgi:alcohol dehydrogenase
MVLAEGGELSDHATRFFPPAEVQIPVRTKPKLPVISLPVTAAGAEITPSFGIRDTDHKLLFWNRDLASKTVLIDPVLSESLPLPLMQQTSMNGIAHCLEGMYSRHRSPVADGLAIQALTVFAHALNDDMDEHEQRWRLLLGGHLSGMVLSMARTCLHHAICHVIGARHSVGHGAANTVILAHALRFNEGQVQHLLAPALAALNQASAMTCTRVSEWISECVSRLGLPSTLSDLGLASHDLPAIAEQTMTERGLALNPRKVTHPDEILLLLQEAL